MKPVLIIGTSKGIISQLDLAESLVRQIEDQTYVRQTPMLVNSRFDTQEIQLTSDVPKSTVFFDGACPLCRAEIGYYRRKDQEDAFCFVDVSEAGAAIPEGITQQRAMERFHVRARDGRVLSGAAAFVEVWAHLPKLRWTARAASLPGAQAALELGYRLFLPVRPFISWIFGQVLKLQSVFAGAKPR